MIELLVVIAIVGVLAALLLPALSKAKEQGNKIECINNLHQLMIAWNLYIDDNDGWLPRNDGGQLAGTYPGFHHYSWTAGWLDYTPNNPDNTNIVYLTTSEYGRIGQYTPGPGIYKCPSDKSWALIDGARHNRVRSYGMNSLLGSSQYSYNNTNSSYYVYWKLSDLGNPPVSKHIVFVDEHEDSINDGFFFVGTQSQPGGQTAWLDLPAGRHGNSATLSFADGHVETKKWHDPRTLLPVTRTTYHPELQLDNKDVIWFKNRATVARNGR